jgi:glycosyltransferase involved in cell wall biosynthesis
MHVGLEATTLRSQRLGGVWRYTDSLIRALGRLPSPHRYSLLFLNAFKPWARVTPPDVAAPSMRLVEVTSVSNFLFTFLAPTLAQRRGWAVESFLGAVDVFHSVNAALLPQREGRRVVTVHDLTCLKFPQFHPWLRRTLFELATNRVARLADAVIVPSSATGRDFASRFPSAAEKIRVIPLAPREHFAPLGDTDRKPAITRHGLIQQDYVLFAGNIEPRKNLLALIDAYNRLRREMRAAPCLAIAGGEGWKNRAIHQAAAASPYAADIRFLGYVPDADLPALMGGALAFVYPAIYEGFGLPPLEAMACGAPVITSNRSSLPEAVGDAALLVDPDDRAALADAMARVVEQESLREDLRERGLKQAQRFSWEQTARLTLRVYEEDQGPPVTHPGVSDGYRGGGRS